MIEPRSEIEVLVERLPHGRDLPLPEPASSGSAGFDLRSAAEGSIRVEALDRVLVPTGLIMAIPRGWEGQVRPRSGRAWKQGLTVINTPGTVDSDYRGEIGVLLVNLGAEPVTIERGERIAQMVFAAVPRVRWKESKGLAGTTIRGDGGFGSTGS